MGTQMRGRRHDGCLNLSTLPGVHGHGQLQVGMWNWAVIPGFRKALTFPKVRAPNDSLVPDILPRAKGWASTEGRGGKCGYCEG